MSNTCFDPLDLSADHDGLASPFRRRLLAAGALGLSTASLPLSSLAASVGRAQGSLFDLPPLAASTADAVRVAPGLKVDLLYAWGDAISDGPNARPDASDSAADQARQAGMHHDGMHFSPFIEHGKPSSSHGLLCINHEYTDDGLLHTDGMKTWSAEKVAKSIAAHGVSVVEVQRQGAAWSVVSPSRYARRITAAAPCWARSTTAATAPPPGAPT